MIAELIGWIATIFRGSGMLAKRAEMVKYLVSIGNLCWMINGIMTRNLPLIVSNGFCLLVMIWEIVPKKRSKRGLDVRLLRKLRKEAERNVIVEQVGTEFYVVRLYMKFLWRNQKGELEQITGPIPPFYSKKIDAIEGCEEERRKYILSKIKRRVY